MALVHDMAESIVGDITPFDGVSKGFPFSITELIRKTKNIVEK